MQILYKGLYEPLLDEMFIIKSHHHLSKISKFQGGLHDKFNTFFIYVKEVFIFFF